MHTLLRHSSNFKENEHKQVTGYREASTLLLGPYLFPCRLFFRLRIIMHCVTIQFNSIGSVPNPFGV
jgi:hypothetical protein